MCRLLGHFRVGLFLLLFLGPLFVVTIDNFIDLLLLLSLVHDAALHNFEDDDDTGGKNRE